ncbi:2-polyprenyl-6-methoxyphenol hydroxylase-like oxidoreductase [Rivularia sp. PCC 7116]|uniref:FAD-dependent oxidoreductase n=1 Tax=Rivularia sp. PCC 7116 TaxID=373994 RepID=UPI00029ED431|nr:NAD(P)/FAD-dependent oxidoreductase [Rivularia sp. PCC 7116]AFY56408.1 2-polyprenyl-6-methoxyphenol hydroxylase-like oxidoreductase [Rivularia sp. PCC 7116]
MSKIIIVGGGLAGGLAAIYLARRGHSVHVVEKRSDPQENISSYVDRSSSRGIGVSMTARGIKAVLGAGIPKEELDLCGEPISGMSFFVGGKFKVRKLVPVENLLPLSLDRSAFQKLLNKHGIINGVKYHFGHKCIDVNLEQKYITTQDKNDDFHYISGDLIIATDGARSKVRQAMQNAIRCFEFHQSFFRHGYKTLVIPDAAKLNFRKELLYFFGMDSKGLFGGRAAIIPDGSISFCICLPYKGAISLNMQKKEEVLQFFTRYLPEMPADTRNEMVKQFLEKPSNDLINARSSTFHYKKNALLLGDSAHATAPFLGQGMNMALEDAQIFSQLLEKNHDDFEKTLPEFTQLRKIEADAMQDMARANYQVLSSSSPILPMRIKYTNFMHKKFPTVYPPDMAEKLYFTSMPYSHLQNLQSQQNVWYKLGRMN